MYGPFQGVINLAISINQLMEEEVLARLNKDDTLTLTSQHQYYNDTSGLPELRKAVANFLTRHHKPTVEIIPDNVSCFLIILAIIVFLPLHKRVVLLLFKSLVYIIHSILLLSVCVCVYLPNCNTGKDLCL